MAGLFALTTTLVAALTGLFLMVQATFPWMTVFNQRAADPAPTRAAAARVDVTDSGPTVAQRTLRQVMATPLRDAFGADWVQVTAPEGVPGMSFGFGCDPQDGLAPTVAQSQRWVLSRPGSFRFASLQISALAYPAGVGAAAVAGIDAAILRCTAASRYPFTGLGAAALRVQTSRSEALVWRRGDVVMVAALSGSDQGSITGLLGGLRVLDAALQKALASTCVDTGADESAADRSPYANRADYRGRIRMERVARDRQPKRYRAENRATAPVVAVPSPALPYPTVTSLPQAPYPSVVRGPAALPTPVPVPVPPTVSADRPQATSKVPRQVPDPQGPGCGWAFTGQAVPPFNRPRAERAFTRKVDAEKKELARQWRAWQDARVAYFADYRAYRRAVSAYRAYAEQVTDVTAAWQKVEAARAAYYAQVAEYEAALAVLEDWLIERETAREEFRDARKACRQQAAEEAEQDATGEDPDDGSGDKDDEQADEPLACPPERPAILDQAPPLVPEQPVPSRVAQLPDPTQTEAP